MLQKNNWCLAQRIRQERLVRSWSQIQLAEMARVSLRTIQRLEKVGRCSAETLLAVASVFEIDVRELTPEKHKRKTIMKILTGHLKKAATAYIFLIISVTVLLSIFFADHYGVVNRSMVIGNDSYLFFLKWGGCIIAIYLGVLSGIVASETQKWFGAAFLAAGIALTAAAFSVLPWIYYPHDQYSASAAWIFNWLPVSLILAVTVFYFHHAFGKSRA